MSQRNAPPYRADHVGSLLRPQRLAEARLAFQAGNMDDAELRQVEDDCIRDAIRMQEAAGLKSITDGEFRRTAWQWDFLSGFEGMEFREQSFGPGFSSGRAPGTTFVTAPVSNPSGVMLDDFRFLQETTTQTAKFCIPAPSLAYHRGGRGAIEEPAYDDLDLFWDDVMAAYEAEIAFLSELGCTYLQLDDTTFAMLCDAKVRGAMTDRGDDVDDLIHRYATNIQRLVAAKPDDMALTVHMCRGNSQSSWIAEGGYEAVAEALFSGVRVDGLFMEWDSDRAGDFEPLRFVPKGQVVVLGLITSKFPELEDTDVIKRRLDEAARYVDMDYLCLSPQCGFASTHHGNKLTEDEQRRKLDLVVELADDIWGRGD
jgi:5-methyltetrahydropteroyltriglutamate--homocysteine methyltransferase